MLTVLISIPALILLWVMVFEYFIKDETERDEFRELFMLDSPIVRIFFVVVLISVLSWLVSFVFPIGPFVSIMNLVENIVGIVWFTNALFAGKVSIWVDILKDKLTSKK